MKLIILLLFFSCTSYEKYKYLSEDFEIPSSQFRADFDTTWNAVINVMKKYDIEIQNQESGVLKTKWIDNTLELNFSDSFGSNDKIKSARFKVLINVNQSFKSNNPITKVNVMKRQLVERDYLQGWKEIKEDHILENTILYRIKRYLAISHYLKRIQEINEKKQIKEFL